MKQIDYNSICHFLAKHPSSMFRTVLQDLRETFEARFSYDALLSIALIYHQHEVKRTYAEKTTEKRVQLYYDHYTDGMLMRQSEEKHGKRKSILLNISEKFSIPPALLARLLLKKYLSMRQSSEHEESEDNAVHVKNDLSRMMKNPFLIPDDDLSFEIRQCVIYDAGYGAVTDSIRHMIGLEYEQKLVDHVKELKIPYLDETDLRKLGYDKTPDVKLEVPIAVEGEVVSWIESKASFGTPDAHLKYLNEQYYSYWNRFGSGLVIYWFGFVDELAPEMRKQGIILMDHFPELSVITRFDAMNTQTTKSF